MGGTRLTGHLRYVYGPLEAVRLVRPIILPWWLNWPITIFYPWDGKSLLARLALAPWRPLSRTHDQLGAPLGRQPRRHLRGDFLCVFPLVFYGLASYTFPFIFYGSIKAITEAVHRWFHFLKYRQCLITAPVMPTACLRARYSSYAFTRSVHQPLAYASSAPTTYLWSTD